MQLASASDHEVVYHTTRTPVFLTVWSAATSRDGDALFAKCRLEGAAAVAAAEAQLLDDLQACTRSSNPNAEVSFEDMSFEDMFQPSVLTDASTGSSRAKFRLWDTVDRDVLRSERADVAAAPIAITVKPDRVFVSWSVSVLEDAPTAHTHAHEAIAKVRRARRALKSLEARVRADEDQADAVIADLKRHGFHE